MKLSGTVRTLKLLMIVVLLSGISACGGGGDGDTPATSSRANFTFNCDLNGLNAALSIDVEAVGQTGIVWGGGSSPSITGVIGTGGFTYYTAGSLQSPTASYSFTGTSEFADFVNLSTLATFRVRWNIISGGLVMEINPFGGTTFHTCAQTGASYL